MTATQASTTLDLFAAPSPAVQEAPASAMLVRSWAPNTWAYRGVLVICKTERNGFIDHWQTAEALAGSVIKSDRQVLLCRAIDAHLNAKGKR